MISTNFSQLFPPKCHSSITLLVGPFTFTESIPTNEQVDCGMQK